MQANNTETTKYWLGQTVFNTVHWYDKPWNLSLNVAVCGRESSGNTTPYIRNGRYSACRQCMRQLARQGVQVLPQLHAAINEYKEFYESSTGFGVTR